MGLLKSRFLLRLINSHIIDASEPSNISSLCKFLSLLAVYFVIQDLASFTDISDGL